MMFFFSKYTVKVHARRLDNKLPKAKRRRRVASLRDSSYLSVGEIYNCIESLKKRFRLVVEWWRLEEILFLAAHFFFNYSLYYQKIFFKLNEENELE